MKTEVDNFIGGVVDQGGGVKALLTSTVTTGNATIAKLYGVQGSGTGDAFARLMLDPAQRAGILTMPATLAVHTFGDTSAPVHRGRFVRSRLLCAPVPDPPDNLMVVAPDVRPGVPVRERFAEHSAQAACRVCHEQMDPIGFGFGNYDGIGGWRDTDAGKPVDASGTIVGGTDVDGPFNGVPDLARKLAASEQVGNCVVSTFVGMTQGPEVAENQCEMKTLRQTYDSARGDVRGLMAGITQLDSFTTRAVLTGEVLP
jgi:hypothetical protein